MANKIELKHNEPRSVEFNTGDIVYTPAYDTQTVVIVVDGEDCEKGIFRGVNLSTGHLVMCAKENFKHFHGVVVLGAQDK